MKKISILNRIPVLLFALFIVIALATCKKDDKGGNDFRLVSTSEYLNNILYMTSHFNYEGEKIMSVLGYEANMDSTKAEYNYLDESAIDEYDYSKSAGAWQEDGKIEYSYSNGKMTQMIIYQTATRSIDPFLKVMMTYENDNLKMESMWFYFEGSWMEVSRIEYTYNGDNLVQTLVSTVFSGNWEPAYKEIITYSGDNIDFITEHEYVEGNYAESYKYDFTYTDSKVSKIVYYGMVDNAWVIDYEDTYVYDGDGNLALLTETTGSDTDKTEFVYEKGKGNLQQLYYQGGGALYKFVPMPTKSGRNNIFSQAEKYAEKFKD